MGGCALTFVPGDESRIEFGELEGARHVNRVQTSKTVTNADCRRATNDVWTRLDEHRSVAQERPVNDTIVHLLSSVSPVSHGGSQRTRELSLGDPARRHVHSAVPHVEGCSRPVLDEEQLYERGGVEVGDHTASSSEPGSG